MTSEQTLYLSHRRVFFNPCLSMIWVTWCILKPRLQRESITLLDAGLTAHLGDHSVKEFNTFLIAMCRLEAETICECLYHFDMHSEVDLQPHTQAEMDSFVRTVQSIIDKYSDPDTGLAPDGGPVNVGFVMGALTA